MPVYETIFRETVAYKFYVKAPNRKVVEAWAKKNTEQLCNDNINRQIVEERGWEELCEIMNFSERGRLDFCLNTRGQNIRPNRPCTLPPLPRKAKPKKKK